MQDKTKQRQQSFPLMIKTGIKSAIQELHTCIPGIIDEFDPVTQFVKVNPAIKRIKQDDTEIQIPPIINAPVYFMRAGGFSITHPIKKGDECWIHFSERSLDSWKKFGEIRRPADIRFHDYSDGFVVPCVTSQVNKIDNFDNENVVIGNVNGEEGSEITSTVTMKKTGEIETKVVNSATTKTVTFTLNTDGTVTVDAESVSFTGDVNVTGDVTADNVTGTTDVTGGGISVKTHTHLAGPLLKDSLGGAVTGQTDPPQ